MTDRLHGIIPPVLTPVDSSGRFDASKMRDYVHWLIEKGVHGLFPNGSTGEFARFDESTRRRIVEAVIDAADGRVPVLVGASEHDVDATLRACVDYYAMGATAAVIVSPIYFRTSQAGLEAYFDRIAESSPLDILLYNIPSLATEIDPETVISLASTSDRIIGIKDSSGNLPNMMRMVDGIRQERPDFVFFTGWDGLVGTMIMHGVQGGMIAIGNVVPEVAVAIYDLCQAGRFADAIELQRRLLPLFDQMLAINEFPEGFRLGVMKRGWKLGQALTPMSECTQRENRVAVSAIGEQIDSLLAALDEIIG